MGNFIMLPFSLINLMKKIIYRLLFKIPFHIYFYIPRFKSFIVINPKLEPHDFRQIFWPDFSKVRNYNLGIVNHIGASGGINSLTLYHNNQVAHIIVYEVNILNRRSLYFNLAEISSEIILKGVSEVGGVMSLKMASNLPGSLTLLGAGSRSAPLYDSISLNEFSKNIQNLKNSLVINCNGFEWNILNYILDLDINFKYLIVYFFDEMAGYDIDLLLNKILNSYILIDIDGPYHLFVNKFISDIHYSSYRHTSLVAN